jgi:hypothetical protein
MRLALPSAPGKYLIIGRGTRRKRGLDYPGEGGSRELAGSVYTLSSGLLYGRTMGSASSLYSVRIITLTLKRLGISSTRGNSVGGLLNR